MADIKISQLGAALTVADTDIIPIVSGGNTLKVTAAQLKEHAIGDDDISDIGDGTPTGAIAALNTELGTTKQALTSQDLGSFSSLSALETALTNLIPNIGVGAIKPITINITTIFPSPFPQATGGWSGYVQPRSMNGSNKNAAMIVLFNQLQNEIIGFDNNGSFTWFDNSAHILNDLSVSKVDKSSVSQFIETIGEVCKNPSGYINGKVFLASNGNTYKALSTITYNATVLTVGTNCKQVYIDDVLSNVNGYVIGGVATLSALESALSTLLQNISAGVMKSFCFSNSANFGSPWPNLTGGWSGWILPRFTDLNGNATSSVVFVCSQLGDSLIGFNNNGTYVWKVWTVRD